jgi:DNA-binding beta-propeller fold protein YncE
VKVFDGGNYQLVKTVSLGSDADNIRFEPERKRIYVGYGTGALAVLDENGTKVGNIALGAHPESFQLERKGPRIFVNLPDSRNVAVVDRRTSAVIANWKTEGALANFPMALDEQDHRLFVVCRQPAVLLVFNTDTGAVIAKLPSVGDCDDVFYDAASKRIYASGGEGAVSIFEQQSPNQYGELGKVGTRKDARTSFFSSEFRSMYVAAREQDGAPAAIYVYTIKR